MKTMETLDETYLVNGGVILKKEDEILESELSRQFHLNTNLEEIRAQYEKGEKEGK